jgi:hypothetical protein
MSNTATFSGFRALEEAVNQVEDSADKAEIIRHLSGILRDLHHAVGTCNICGYVDTEDDLSEYVCGGCTAEMTLCTDCPREIYVEALDAHYCPGCIREKAHAEAETTIGTKALVKTLERDDTAVTTPEGCDNCNWPDTARYTCSECSRDMILCKDCACESRFPESGPLYCTACVVANDLVSKNIKKLESEMWTRIRAEDDDDANDRPKKRCKNEC